MFNSITGVVIAGGKSTRMGCTKAVLPWHGKLLIESPLQVLSEIFAKVVISVAANNAFPQLPYLQIADRYGEIGPLGAIASVLESGESRIFCVACDMPFLNRALIEFLCGFDSADAVVPIWHGRPEVLHALYSRNPLPSIQESIRRGRFRVTDGLSEGNIHYVNEAEIRKYDPSGYSFRNVNTPAEYEALVRLDSLD